MTSAGLHQRFFTSRMPTRQRWCSLGSRSQSASCGGTSTAVSQGRPLRWANNSFGLEWRCEATWTTPAWETHQEPERLVRPPTRRPFRGASGSRGRLSDGGPRATSESFPQASAIPPPSTTLMGRAAMKGLTVLHCLGSWRYVTATCRNLRCASWKRQWEFASYTGNPKSITSKCNGSWTAFAFPGWWPPQIYMWRTLHPLTRGNKISDLARIWGNRNQTLWKQLKSPAVRFCPCMDFFSSEKKKKPTTEIPTCILAFQPSGLLLYKEELSVFSTFKVNVRQIWTILTPIEKVFLLQVFSIFSPVIYGSSFNIYLSNAFKQ